jgi:two-component system, OmpR family, response regulator
LKKVLVVDDAKNIRNLLTTCLELAGHIVLTAKDGIEAMELIEKEIFDFAFIDVQIPELSGTEVLRRLRNMGLTYPVVVMTARSSIKNAIECTKLGAIAYLQKPFSVDKVNDIVNLIKTSKVKEDEIYVLIKQVYKLVDNNILEDALRLLKKGLSMHTSNGEIYYLMGRIYEKKHNMAEAKKYYSVAEIFDYKQLL